MHRALDKPDFELKINWWSETCHLHKWLVSNNKNQDVNNLYEQPISRKKKMKPSKLMQNASYIYKKGAVSNIDQKAKLLPTLSTQIWESNPLEIKAAMAVLWTSCLLFSLFKRKPTFSRSFLWQLEQYGIFLEETPNVPHLIEHKRFHCYKLLQLQLNQHCLKKNT